MKLGLDHGALVIAIGALVVLSIWPLPSSHGGEGEQDDSAGGHAVHCSCDGDEASGH